MKTIDDLVLELIESRQIKTPQEALLRGQDILALVVDELEKRGVLSSENDFAVS
jgi:predicted RNase H-like HicB family nuclease